MYDNLRLPVEIGEGKDWKTAWMSSRHGPGCMRQQLTNTFRTAFLACRVKAAISKHKRKYKSVDRE